jgi:hypothetical protein
MIYQHKVEWGNPFTEPPNNLPKVLVALDSDQHRPPEWFQRKREAIIDRLRLRGIYSYCMTFDWIDDKPKKRWSEEAKKRNRLRRLKSRLSKKYSIPELLESAIQEQIDKKPEYYQ